MSESKIKAVFEKLISELEAIVPRHLFDDVKASVDDAHETVQAVVKTVDDTKETVDGVATTPSVPSTGNASTTPAAVVPDVAPGPSTI
jgi:hypothetical protein